MKVDVWRISKKRIIIYFTQKAQIILKMYNCCRKRNRNKIVLRLKVVKNKYFFFHKKYAYYKGRLSTIQKRTNLILLKNDYSIYSRRFHSWNNLE